jgi:beta-propeller repeat-containing protein
MLRRPCKFHLLHLSRVAAVTLLAVVSLSAQQGKTPENSSRTTGLINPTASRDSATALGNNPAQWQQSDKMRVEAGYSNLPLSFEPNRGQTDAQVKFLSRAGKRTLWLTNDEAVLAVAGTVLRMTFTGANTKAEISGENKQPGMVNYFVGAPEQWRTRIPVYARVRYKSLYRGVDLVFYSNNRQLEYDMVVSPGADPSQIKLAVQGARKIRIDGAGNLVLETPAGDVIQQKPRIYQRQGKTLTAVSGRYVIDRNEVRFALGAYDRTAPVVIDPVLRYSTILGGSNIDLGHGVVVAGSNRAIVAGTACSRDFPATGSSKPPSVGLCSAFVTKFDFTGSQLIFSTLLGDGAQGNAVARDSSGNIYVTGDASGAFPTTAGAFQTTFGGETDAFVTKLGSGGSTILYSTFLGGSGIDFGNSIAVDSSGNAYVAGTTRSADFPTTAGVFQHDCNLSENGNCNSVFVTKLNASGSKALYSTFLGGHDTQNGTGIKVNSAGNAFVSGDTGSSDFPTTAGTAQPVFHGATDAFVAEFSASGSHLIYSTFLGGGSFDSAAGIALDSFGNAYVTGGTALN